MFKNKISLVTGGTGLIGRQLVDLLIERGAHVRVASLDDPSLAHPKCEFHQIDLTLLENCVRVCKGVDYVFHLACIKGSPDAAKKYPASFFVPAICFNTHMMEAAFRNGVERYLYSSSVAVYSPSEILKEDSVWNTMPSEKDRFAGWAKRMGELQAEAYRIEHGWNKVSIVRPPNVYGPYDNFDPKNAMVIPSLIRRAIEGEDPLVIWGDGTEVRDFIHARDVAEGMLLVMEKEVTEPVNLGTGKGNSVKEIVSIILKHLNKSPKILWDTSKTSGDKKRVVDVSRAQKLGFEPKISLETGIQEVIDWYLKNQNISASAYNIFSHSQLDA